MAEQTKYGFPVIGAAILIGIGAWIWSRPIKEEAPQPTIERVQAYHDAQAARLLAECEFL